MPLTRAKHKQGGGQAGSNKMAPSCGEEGSRKRQIKKKKKILLKDSAKSRSTTRSGREYGSCAEEKGSKKGNRKWNSKSPVQTRQSKENIRKVQIEELKQRIASITIKNRPLPESDNINILATELKIRLAATSDVIEERIARRGCRVEVNVLISRHRHVALWDINKQQDATLICLIKVPVNKPKNPPRRNRL